MNSLCKQESSPAKCAILILRSGTVPREPPIRLLAMPVSSMLYAFGVQMLIIDIMRYFNIRAPIRISSLPRGSPLRPGIYSIIEDVVAVDGSGGLEFRQRLNLRYQASHHFRKMLHRLTLFWALGSLAAASATTAIIFTTHRNVAYVVCFHMKRLPTCIFICLLTSCRRLGGLFLSVGLPSGLYSLRGMSRYS